MVRGVLLDALLVACALGVAADEAALDILRKVDGRDRGEDRVARGRRALGANQEK